MLDTLRRGASSWISKVLMGILVISFAVWGVGDMFTNLAQNTVAEVGGVDIPVERFQADYQRAIQAIGQQSGRQISPQQAVQVGIPQQILGRLVTETVMSSVAQELGLGLSTEQLAQQIRSDPTFQNAAGDFDRARMRELLASNDLSEDDYIETMEGLADRRQIADGLVGGFMVPTVLVEAQDRYRNQERTIRSLTITPAMIPPVAAPGEEALAAYFEANKARFRAPEYRSFAVVVADPAKMADPKSVSDDDAHAAYDGAPGRFGTPEKRRVEQVVFPDRASADAAAKRLAEGVDLGTILAERNVKPADADLGLVAKGELIDPAVAAAAFAAAEDTAVVVDGRFGPVLVRVTEIVPADRQPFDAVKDTLKAELAADQAEREMLNVYDSIEDARAGGATLKEIADRFGLEYVAVEPVDRSGNGPDGATRAVPQANLLLPQVFANEPGDEPDPVQFGRRGFAWFDVTEVTPARDRTLEEARPAVVAAWTADEEAKAVAAKAAEVAASIHGGESIDAAAAALGTTAVATGPFKRTDDVPAIGAEAVSTAFESGPGSVATAGAPDGGQLVLVVETVTDPVFFAEAEAAQVLTEELSRKIGNTLLGDYVSDLEAAAGVSINQPVLMRAIGLDRNPGDL